ncbi:hypothetical protein DVH24_006205 [Malus domestica]|uniref:Uncharacterized protein n=1 Tax=Malus domestica TaxID=3750 RepID=A0A498KP04_MALDO|nr:hypothetical protein DVH24_006205 [Malus domestica]
MGFIIPFSRVVSLPNEENDKSSSSDAQGMDRSPWQQSLYNHRRENIVVILSSIQQHVVKFQMEVGSRRRIGVQPFSLSTKRMLTL